MLTQIIPCLITSLPAPWELEANFCLLYASFWVLYICSLIGSISLGLPLSACLNPLSYPKEKLGGRSTYRVHIGCYQGLRSPIEIRSLSRACVPAYQTLQPDKRPWKEGLLTGVGVPLCVCVRVRCKDNIALDPELEASLVLLFFHVQNSGVGLDNSPRSQRGAYEWIHHIHIYSCPNPSRNVPQWDL